MFLETPAPVSTFIMSVCGGSSVFLLRHFPFAYTDSNFSPQGWYSSSLK